VLTLAVETPVPLDSWSVLEFHGDSYVELKLSNNVAKTFAYDIWFLPTKPDGLLAAWLYDQWRF